MQQHPPSEEWPQQWQPPQGYGQPSQPLPHQGQWQQPYTPYPPQQGYPPQQSYLPQQGQWLLPYGQPPPQQPKKKSGKLKWVLISLGILLILGIGACALVSSAFNAENKQLTTGTVTTNNTSSSSSSSSSNTTTQVGKVGDTITIDSVGCTLVSVKKLAADESRSRSRAMSSLLFI